MHMQMLLMRLVVFKNSALGGQAWKIQRNIYSGIYAIRISVDTFFLLKKKIKIKNNNNYIYISAVKQLIMINHV